MLVKQPSRRSAFVLLAVLVVVVILALTGYHYSDWMQSEYQAALNARKVSQARSFAESGIYYAAALLSDPDALASTLNDNPYDNPGSFRDVAVALESKTPGRFSLLAPGEADAIDSQRFGVTDEGGKINLNALLKRDPTGKIAYDMLLKLPDMTDEIAASIVDWIDADNDPHTNGAENDHYSGLSPAYRSKNGPLDSLEELLLVKGVTPELLFGDDKNRNGLQDTDEAGTNRGWSAFLTVYSREQNVDSSWQARAYLNGDELDTLYEHISADLGDDLAKFILLYRQYGSATSSGKSQSLGSSIAALLGVKSKSSSSSATVAGNLAQLTMETLLKKKASVKIKSLFELMDSQVSVAGSGKNPTVVYTSPLKDAGIRRSLLAKLLEKATVFADSDLPARININTAPREVLACLPGLTDSDVQSIVSQRPAYAGDPPGEIYLTPAWLATEANLKTDILQQLEPYITTRTQVYRLQSVGYFDTGAGPTVRMEAVVDINAGRPRFLLWRDLSELGMGSLKTK